MTTAAEAPSPSFALIALQGEYDLARQPELRSQLAAGTGFELVLLDLHDVTFIDATALTEFIRLKKQLAGPAVVRVFGVTPHIRKLFHVTGLNTRFEIHDSLLSACRPPSPVPAANWRHARRFAGPR